MIKNLGWGKGEKKASESCYGTGDDDSAAENAFILNGIEIRQWHRNDYEKPG